MALWHEKKLENDIHLGIWKIEEDEAFFLNRLTLAAPEMAEFSRIKGRRRLEWLASRYLVHWMLSDEPEWDRIPLHKDDCGKPHLHGSPLHLSFSHSHEFVAVILATRSVGIDIQFFVPRIDRIAHKFMRPEELASLQDESRLAHLHFFWNAKEALFKAYGRKQLDWKMNILVEPFEYQDFTLTKGLVTKDDFHQAYRLYFEKHDAYFLGYCLSV